jgi:drug/metabolite transporter (DMT)-like permease|tara:strand:- start:286 stop:1152 length:867 start_codon:yes stop_codon:yes gene_type:complete
MSNKIFSSVSTAILSAFFFSLAATTAPYFYGVGGGVFLLLSVRYVSTFIFASILNKSPKKIKSKATHIRLILISIFQAIFIASYMYSISLIPLSLAVVVIYTFPIITFFVNSILKSRSIDFLSAAALLVSLFGIWILVQGDSSNWNLWGVFWGLIASLAQVTVNILSRHKSVESGWGLIQYIMVLPSVVFVLIYFIVTLEPIASVSSEMLLWSILSAMGMTGGIYFFFRSISIIGPVRTSNVMYLEPIFTIILGVILLQDMLGMNQWLGMFIIFTATISLERWGKKYN